MIKTQKQEKKQLSSEYYKAYYANNKEKLNKRIVCETCGCEVIKRNLKMHQNSKLHKRIEKYLKERAVASNSVLFCQQAEQSTNP